MPTPEEIALSRMLKALEDKAHTSDSKSPWEELLRRDTTIPAAKALQASKIIAGLSGSWAGSWTEEYGAEHKPSSVAADQAVDATMLSPRVPTPVRRVTTRLGAPGLPEINFVPYSHRTNRFGSKGPSLLGHPVSFSIIGPTRKNPACDWQWDVNAAGASDILTMANGPSGAATTTTLAGGYNLSGTPDDYGGLYIVITDNGSAPGSLLAPGAALTPITGYERLTRFEVFRVISIRAGEITLAPNKRLADYFTVPGANAAIRSLMIVKPYVTRLQAVPGSGEGVGRERIFVVCSPETAANTDIYPPYDGGIASDGSWAQGGFESTGVAGEVVAYGGEYKLPIEKPLRSMVGRVEQNAAVLPADGPGFWRITNIPGGSGVSNADEGRILHVYNVDSRDDGTTSLGTTESLLGWYEIHEVIGVTGYVLKRLPEVDPTTGAVYFGPGPFFDSSAAAAPSRIYLGVTIHDAVETLWEGAYNADNVDAARLTNLIDPTWVERSAKIASTEPRGFSPARADKAIFDTGYDATTGYANPGSLLDLGFRMVLFPAKENVATGAVEPDFSQPIDMRDLIIDPDTTTEQQTVYVDYSAGTVILSHAPPARPAGQIIPNGIVGTAAGDGNTRAEVVLYAACVPFSMEKGQLGASVKLTGGALEAATAGYGSEPQTSVYGSKVYASITSSGPGATDDITLAGPITGFPPTGFVEVLHGATPFGNSQGLWGYTSVDYTVLAAPVLQGVYTDEVAAPTLPAACVVRKDPSIDHRYDRMYGQEVRSDTFRFAYANLLGNADGSISVMPTAVAGPAEELRAYFPLGSSSEVARFNLDPKSQNWTAQSPPWESATDVNEVGLEITRGKILASMSQDLGADTLRYSRFMNVATEFALDVGAAAATTVPSHFIVNCYAPGAWPGTAFPDTVPTDYTGLCVAIEGSSVATAEVGSWVAPVAAQRLLLDIKRFGPRTDNDVLQRQDEGPFNPLNWLAYTAAGADTPTVIHNAINAHYNAQTPPVQPCEIMGAAATERVLITERQVTMLPTRPFLESKDVSGGITIGVDGTLLISVFSADPKNDCGGRWITFQMPTTGTAWGEADPDVIAGVLNDALYNPASGVFMGAQLDNAGFYATDPALTASPNPALVGWGVGERQFLFVGPNDARHPTGADTVCLLCGGFGASVADGSTDRNFYNVMIAIGKSEGRDIAQALGGDFSPVPYEQPRCGLFWGAEAAAKPPVGPPVASPFTLDTLNAALNISLGFKQNGVEPLGGFCGSFPVTSTETVGAPSVSFKLPVGSDSPYYRGPQQANITTLTRTGNQAVTDKLESYPYLGRWSWGLEAKRVVDITGAGNAGHVAYWLSYSTKSHDETGFKSYLRSASQVGYENCLTYVEDPSGNISPPVWGTASLTTGDLVSVTLAGVAPAFTGIVWDWSNGEGQFLLAPRGPFSTEDGIIAEGAQPTLFGTFSALINPTNTTPETSYIPNPDGISASGAVRALYDATNLTTTSTSDNYGQGLDGGSEATGNTKTNAIIMGAGRINLLSLIGPNAPAGMSFSSSVIGENLTASGTRLATTFMEHGVFSTSVTLNSYKYMGAMQDSAGLFDASSATLEGTGKGQAGDSHMVGGVGGLRVSGDAQVWLTNLRALGSESNTAHVRQATAEVTLNITNIAGTGPVTAMAFNADAGHAPSGFYPAHATDPAVPNSFYVLQEATVTLGLTRPDLYAFMAMTGNFAWPTTPDLVYTATGGAAYFQLGQSAHDGFMDAPLRVLAGMYLALEDGTGGALPVNNGVWRITGTPMVTSTGTKGTLESAFPGYAYMDHGNVDTDTGEVPTFYQRMEQGRIPESAVVAVLQVQVERYALPTDFAAVHSISFRTEATAAAASGHLWQITSDEAGLLPVYVADVVDPGGSPTGLPKSIRGLSLMPGEGLASGGTTFPLDMVSVFPDGTRTEAWPLAGRGELLGIQECVDHRGRMTSHAFFTTDIATPAKMPVKAYARATIYAAQRVDRMDALSTTTTKGEFSVDEAGRVDFVGHPARLGPGVLMDGGLGMVQAAAFRATPKPPVTETVGAMTIYGQDAGFPLPNHLHATANIGAAMPSTFNAVEFYEHATVVGPYGMLKFEDGRAQMGLPSLLRSVLLASKTYNNPARLMAARQTLTVPGDVLTQSAFALAADTLFPFFTAGIKFSSPGGVVYERAFRPVDATGGAQAKDSFSGMPKDAGIKGLEIPAHGECLLLPKGPPTMTGSGRACFTSPEDVTGQTPLDVPLYDFFGGQDAVAGTMASPEFPIRCESLLSGGVVPAVNEGNALHLYGPGTMSQAYRHSTSREGADYPLSKTSEQVRVLDGMIIEDTTNGTFYTVGDIGRWKAFTHATADLEQPGAVAGNRSSVNGSLVVNGTTAEIIYDLGQHFDPTIDLLTPANVNNGLGDRVDNGQVRRPLKGHRYRVTPNVEFVPVLGPRGVDGGLLPPLTNQADLTTTIPDADALFYSLVHSFTPVGAGFGAGDVGRFIYICGTWDYGYTGWWLIMDVIDSYDVQPGFATNVAVLKKWRKDGNRKPSTHPLVAGALPLTSRTPLVQMAGDHLTNDEMFTGHVAEYGDLRLEITDDTGAAGYTVPVPAADLTAHPVTSASTLSGFLNGDVRTNGSDMGTTLFGVATPNAIIWASVDGGMVVYYARAALTDAQWVQLTGHAAMIRVSFLSNNVGHAAGATDIGFYSYAGSNSEIDRGAGDRNNSALMTDGYATTSYAAAAGLRWVFSSPLVEENVGSYLHLTKPRLYRFGTALTSQGAVTDAAAWASGYPRSGDGDQLQTSIFRLCRDPSTADIVVGGDCETYRTEIIQVATSGVVSPPATTDKGLGRPILYSPLSVGGLWPDTVTGVLPNTGATNAAYTYSLQPIARERLVRVSPNSGRSSIVMAHGDSAAAAGPQGVGPAASITVALSDPAMDMSEPWVLMSRQDVQPLSGIMAAATEEMFNGSPALAHVWAPAAEWWELRLPSQKTLDASEPPPTLRFDLTESFTQAMVPGAGLNSPYPGHAPKGARLNRIWVNFGMWPEYPADRTNANIPGYVPATGSVLDSMGMTFNLVLEIPGSDTRAVSAGDHPLHSGTGGLPFGDRAPYATYNHADNTTNKFPGGTIVVPLSLNREAGEIMPNVMERWVSAGPESAATNADWVGGDYEFGFGCSTDEAFLANAMEHYNDLEYVGNSHNPVTWGGLDFTLGATHPEAVALASVFPRTNVVGGGVRSAFTSGLIPNTSIFQAAGGPESLNSATLTGITVCHGSKLAEPPSLGAGSDGSNTRSPYTCPHAFTMALTPVGDDFDTAAGTTVMWGRALENPAGRRPENRPFKVGNFLDSILDKYGIPAPSGSMLPPGARLVLEVTVTPGNSNVRTVTPGNSNVRASGAWVCAPILSFEVESTDGIAVTDNVNVLG